MTRAAEALTWRNHPHGSEWVTDYGTCLFPGCRWAAQRKADQPRRDRVFAALGDAHARREEAQAHVVASARAGQISYQAAGRLLGHPVQPGWLASYGLPWPADWPVCTCEQGGRGHSYGCAARLSEEVRQ